MSFHNYHIDTDPGPQLQEKLKTSILDNSAGHLQEQGDQGAQMTNAQYYYDDTVQYMRSKVYQNQAPLIDDEKYCAQRQQQMIFNEKLNNNVNIRLSGQHHQGHKESMNSKAALLQNDDELDKSNRISVLSRNTNSNQNGPGTFDRQSEFSQVQHKNASAKQRHDLNSQYRTSKLSSLKKLRDGEEGPVLLQSKDGALNHRQNVSKFEFENLQSGSNEKLAFSPVKMNIIKDKLPQVYHRSISNTIEQLTNNSPVGKIDFHHPNTRNKGAQIPKAYLAYQQSSSNAASPQHQPKQNRLRQYSTYQEANALDLDQLVFFRNGHDRHGSRQTAFRSSLLTQPRSQSLDQLEFPSRTQDDLDNQEQRLLRNSDVIEIDHSRRVIDLGQLLNSNCRNDVNMLPLNLGDHMQSSLYPHAGPPQNFVTFGLNNKQNSGQSAIKRDFTGGSSHQQFTVTDGISMGTAGRGVLAQTKKMMQASQVKLQQQTSYGTSPTNKILHTQVKRIDERDLEVAVEDIDIQMPHQNQDYKKLKFQNMECISTKNAQCPQALTSLERHENRKSKILSQQMKNRLSHSPSSQSHVSIIDPSNEDANNNILKIESGSPGIKRLMTKQTHASKFAQSPMMQQNLEYQIASNDNSAQSKMRTTPVSQVDNTQAIGSQGQKQVAGGLHFNNMQFSQNQLKKYNLQWISPKALNSNTQSKGDENITSSQIQSKNDPYLYKSGLEREKWFNSHHNASEQRQKNSLKNMNNDVLSGFGPTASLHIKNIDLAMAGHGDYGIDSPTQSILDQQILDQQIVSVQNTRQMQWSTRKHMVEQHLNALASGNGCSNMLVQDQRNGSFPQNRDFSQQNRDEYLTTIERCQRTGKIEITLRFCTQCLMDMPLRAKHCKMCQKCISTYDHHCPWLGNCVGERNRKHFYVYLWLQEIQLFMIMFMCLKLTKNLDDSKTFGWICFSIDVLFQLFVVYLIVFHTYLAASNMTTWECLSWEKISYLKLWPRRMGSPFNIGLKKNLKLYFCYNLTGDNYFVWRLPKNRPDIMDQIQKQKQQIQQQNPIQLNDTIKQQYYQMVLAQSRIPFQQPQHVKKQPQQMAQQPVQMGQQSVQIGHLSQQINQQIHINNDQPIIFDMSGAFRNASLNGMSGPNAYKNGQQQANSHPTQQHQMTPIGGNSCCFKSPNSQQIEDMVNEIVQNAAVGQGSHLNPQTGQSSNMMAPSRGSLKHNNNNQQQEKMNTQQYDTNAVRFRQHQQQR